MGDLRQDQQALRERLNKLLEPSLGAVYGKVCILVLVILFLEWRPSGLFAIKGRHADS